MIFSWIKSQFAEKKIYKIYAKTKNIYIYKKINPVPKVENS